MLLGLQIIVPYKQLKQHIIKMFCMVRINYYHILKILFIRTRPKNFVLTCRSQTTILYSIQLVQSSELDSYLLDTSGRDLWIFPNTLSQIPLIYSVLGCYHIHSLLKVVFSCISYCIWYIEPFV